MARALTRGIRTEAGKILPRKLIAAKPSKKADADLDGFFAAQKAAFEDGRAYVESRRRRPRK
jgi:hypothetical protein